MKLTITQIITLQEGAEIMARHYRARAEAAADADLAAYWRTEAESAEQLHDALKDALSVTIESARLDAPGLPV